MAIKDWPEQQRPRERLISKGAATLSDPELLAVFLRVGTKGRSAVELGSEALQRFGSLHGLFEASLEQFSAIPGMGPAKFAQLQAVMELAQRACSNKWPLGNCLTRQTWCAAICARDWPVRGMNRSACFSWTSKTACSPVKNCSVAH